MIRQKPFSVFRAAALLLLLVSGSAFAHELQTRLTDTGPSPGNPSDTATPLSPDDTEAPSGQSTPEKKKIAIVLFPGFETLDVFGPAQMWGRLDDYDLVMVSQYGSPVKAAQGFETVATYSFDNAPQFDIILVPGAGSKTIAIEAENPALLAFLRRQDRGTQLTTSVCSGSALLARAGILDGRKATSNKRSWEFVTSQSSKVSWQGRARWVEDGKYVTSSGVSAGMDMALALVEMLYGRERAERVARSAEYIWNDNPTNDPFAVE